MPVLQSAVGKDCRRSPFSAGTHPASAPPAPPHAAITWVSAAETPLLLQGAFLASSRRCRAAAAGSCRAVPRRCLSFARCSRPGHLMVIKCSKQVDQELAVQRQPACSLRADLPLLPVAPSMRPVADFRVRAGAGLCGGVR